MFEIAYLPDEVISKFKSDFRIVADFFAQKRKNKAYKPSSQKIKHVDELLKLMKAITGDTQYIAANKEGGKEIKAVLEKTHNKNIRAYVSSAKL